MRADADHGRRHGAGGRAARRVAVALGALALAGLASTVAVAQAPVTVVAQDRADAADGTPDLKRVGVTRVAGGGLRVALSLAGALVPRDLLADADAGGPPGSLCVRLWTVSAPGSAPPDLLACVTARADGRTLRATTTREVADGFPTVVARSTPTRASPRTVVLRVPAGVLGGARRVAFAGEATRPGCVRLSCVDLAPDAGATKTLALR